MGRRDLLRNQGAAPGAGEASDAAGLAAEREAAERLAEQAEGPLCYIGRGAALPDVPARDLSADEAAALGRAWLLASGLYGESEG